MPWTIIVTVTLMDLALMSMLLAVLRETSSTLGRMQLALHRCLINREIGKQRLSRTRRTHTSRCEFVRVRVKYCLTLTHHFGDSISSLAGFTLLNLLLRDIVYIS